MEKAKRLLADTDEKIAVVSELVGYEDTSFFSKLFARPHKQAQKFRPSSNQIPAIRFSVK
jgi:AraC-like DNA-binding protein